MIGEFNVRYVSLAFDFVDESKLDYFQETLIRLSCDLWQIENLADIKFEVLVNIDRSTNHCISAIRDNCTISAINGIDIKLVSSDKLSKRYTLPTLSVDTYGGDILVYTRNIEQMSELLYSKNVYHLLELFSMKSHVKFITATGAPNVEEFYGQFYTKYHSLPKNTIGFIATRNATNALEQTEFDYYDAVLAISMINLSIDKEALTISSRDNEIIYSDEEKEELLVKFLPDYYRESPNNLQTLNKYSFSMWLAIFLVVGIVYKMITFYYAVLIILVAEFIERSFIISSTQSKLLRIATQQSFAAANKKRVAGRPVITQLNKS